VTSIKPDAAAVISNGWIDADRQHGTQVSTPVWVRLLLVLLLLSAVLFALSTWVFPYIDEFVTNQEATVGGQ